MKKTMKKTVVYEIVKTPRTPEQIKRRKAQPNRAKRLKDRADKREAKAKAEAAAEKAKLEAEEKAKTEKEAGQVHDPIDDIAAAMGIPGAVQTTTLEDKP
jgi:membrane protein involved in colicin uptake